MNEASPGFPDRLKAAHEARGVPVNELNRLSGLSMGQISNLLTGKRGKKVQVGTLAKIAEILQVSIDWLWLGSGAMTQVDPYADQFFTSIAARGLAAVVKEHPGRWRLSTVTKALAAVEYLDAAPGDWIQFLDKVQLEPRAPVDRMKRRRIATRTVRAR